MSGADSRIFALITIATVVVIPVFIILRNSQRLGSYSILTSDAQLDEKDQLFEEFIIKYNRSYLDNDDYTNRFEIFRQNLVRIDNRNDEELRAGGDAVFGVTQFADMSQAEFESSYLGFVEINDNSTEIFTLAHDAGNVSTVNWAGIYTTSVNDQGACGSCWSFSSVEQVESNSIMAGYTNTSEKFSYQQLVSCDPLGSCSGGSTTQAYEYIHQIGGIDTDKDYPYHSTMGKSGICETKTTRFVVTVDHYYQLGSEDEMETYVLTTGPLSVCIDASSWPFYESGILSSCNNTVNHCVQAVGINSEERYWIVRNSWGTTWGMDGYIYLESGVNMCNIANIPTFTKTSPVEDKEGSTDD